MDGECIILNAECSRVTYRLTDRQADRQTESVRGRRTDRWVDGWIDSVKYFISIIDGIFCLCIADNHCPRSY